jgi:hypothetical protein
LSPVPVLSLRLAEKQKIAKNSSLRLVEKPPSNLAPPSGVGIIGVMPGSGFTEHFLLTALKDICENNKNRGIYP